MHPSGAILGASIARLLLSTPLLRTACALERHWKPGAPVMRLPAQGGALAPTLHLQEAPSGASQNAQGHVNMVVGGHALPDESARSPFGWVTAVLHFNKTEVRGPGVAP